MPSLIISRTRDYAATLFSTTYDKLDFTNTFPSTAKATFSAGQIDGFPILANGLKVDGSVGVNILTITNVQNYQTLAPTSWTFTNWAASDRVEFYGTVGNDSLRGASPLADFVYGGTGNDMLITDDGTDRLYGGDGNDTFFSYNSDGAMFFGGLAMMSF